jgi:hypothetical protein
MWKIYNPKEAYAAMANVIIRDNNAKWLNAFPAIVCVLTIVLAAVVFFWN